MKQGKLKRRRRDKDPTSDPWAGLGWLSEEVERTLAPKGMRKLHTREDRLIPYRGL